MSDDLIKTDAAVGDRVRLHSWRFPSKLRGRTGVITAIYTAGTAHVTRHSVNLGRIDGRMKQDYGISLERHDFEIIEKAPTLMKWVLEHVTQFQKGVR